MTAAPAKPQWWEAAPLATPTDRWWEAAPVTEDQFFPPRTDIENSELLALLAPIDRKAIDTEREDVAAALAEKGRPTPPGRVTLEQAQRDLGRPIAGAALTRSAAGEVASGLGRGLMLALEGLAGAAEMTTLPRRAGMPPLTAIPRGIGQQAFAPSTEVAEGPIFNPSNWRWWAARGPEVVGTMLPALIPGVGAAALASRAGLGAKMVTLIAASVGGTIAGAIEGGLSFETMRDLLIDRGYSPEEAESIARLGALGYGVAAGITEVVPLAIIFKRVPGVKRFFVKTLLAAITEGGQEAVQTVLERTAQVLTDADPSALEFDEDFREELKAAAVLGAGAGGVSAAAVSAAQAAPEPPAAPPAAEPPPPPRRYKPSELTSREGLMQFARDNPDLALKLSKRAVPSRKDLSRLTPSGMSMSREQRREMGDLLRSEVLPALRKEAQRGQEEREVRAVRPAREGEQPPQERVGAEARELVGGVPREPQPPAEARAEVAEVPRETLSTLSYRELQKRAKANGIKANQTKEELIRALDLEAQEAAKRKAIKREPKGQLKFVEKPTDARQGGFVAIPTTPAGGRGPQSPGGGKIESGLPPIEIYGKPKDITAVQRYIMATQNAAIQSKNPEIIGAVETMIDLDIQRIQDTETDLDEDRAQFKRLPREYKKKNGAKLFALMDELIRPEEIAGRTDIPDAVKPVLRHFKNRSEKQRLTILDRKRDLARAVAAQQTGSELLETLQFLAPNRFQGRLAGPQVIRVFDIQQDRLLTKPEVNEMMATLAYPDDWGRRYEYIHHAFFGEYVLTWLDEEGDSHFIGRAETQAEAYDKLNAFRLRNKDIPVERLRAVPEVFVPPDITRVSTGRLRVLQSQLKMAANLNSAEVQAALRGVVGQRRSRQKFWGALMQRQGAKGFEQDFWRVWEAQTTMYHRWFRLTEMNRAIVPVIEKIRSRGLPSWAEHLQNTLDHVWGRKRGVLAERVDELAKEIPLLGRFMKPFVLERSLSMIRAVNYYRHLQTFRFYVLNRFQPLQTLWPVVGERGMFRGFRLRYSKRGRELLRRHKVSAQMGKLREEERVTRAGRGLRRLLPAGASEIENQRLAFLTLYDHGLTVLKLDDAAAARYARLRGQVYTQFLFSRADQPAFLRHPIPQTLFQYKRFAIKNLGLLANMATNGQFGGVARWVSAQLFIGGLRAVWPRTILGLIGRGGLLFLLWNELKEKLGEDRARLILYGLPSLVGVDMSQSVNVFEFPRGKSAAERLGNLLFGPTLQTAAEVVSAVLLEKKAVQEHGLLTGAKQLLASSPTFRQFEAAMKALSKDTTTFDVKGRKRHELELKDMWKKAFGFRPISESVVSLDIDRLLDLQRIYDKAADRSAIRWATGDRDGAIRELERWNARFPDIPMRLADVVGRARSRVRLRQQDLVERQIQARPRKVRAQAAREGIAAP